MRSLLIVTLILILRTAGAEMTWHVVQFDRHNYVPVSDVARFYRMERTVVAGTSFHLISANRSIVGKAGSTDVGINGVKYVTCFPLRERDGVIYLSAMDVTKVIEPIMRPGKIKGGAAIRTVVLDAGHGGHDSGAVGPFGREKDYTLDVVLRARALLLRAGYQVKLTRAYDVFIPLDERSAFANEFPNALFFSVHFNKSNTYGGTGIETYALAPRGVPSMDEESLRYSDFTQNPGNACDPQNIALAAAVHSCLVRNLGMVDRGIKRARFAVIKNIRIPGVLIEGGFVDSPYDSRMIAMPEYRQRIAQSILQATVAYSHAVGGDPEHSVVINAIPPPAASDVAPLSPPPAPAPVQAIAVPGSITIDAPEPRPFHIRLEGDAIRMDWNRP